MGVRGLTTYIAKHADQYLQTYELHDCYIVIDGNNIASQLYNWFSKCNCAFGGDYDTYRETVINFFTTLRKCNIKPLVLFDGGYESRKLATVKMRFRTRYYAVKNITPVNQSKLKVFPLLMREEFKDTLASLKVSFLQCDFEADGEIAAFARHIGCPVLSYDSDFYIYDVLYIPFSTLEMEVTRHSESEYYYLQCKIYTINNFLKTFGGLEIKLIPLIATLLGNDYIKPCIFDNFFSQIKLPKGKAMNETQKKISGLFRWLETENLETAVTKILKHLKKTDRNFVEEQINRIAMNYSLQSKMSHSYLKILNETEKEFNEHESVLKVDSSNTDNSEIIESGKLPILPEWFKVSFSRGLLHSSFLDMLIHNIYFLTPQVEDFSLPFSHDISFPIINQIFNILISCDGYSNKNVLTCYCRGKYGGLKQVLLTSQTLSTSIRNSISLSNMHDLSVHERVIVLFESMGLSEYIDIINQFTEDWKLFVIALVYWFRNMEEPKGNFSHLSAAILCAIILKVIDVNCGYCRNTKSLKKSFDYLMKSSKEPNFSPNKESENGYTGEEIFFKDVSDRISTRDCFAAAESLLQFHKIDERSKTNVKLYCKTTVHAFAQLQSCIFHCRLLNSLLNFPLPQIQMSQVFTGTLVYNLYTSFQKRSNVSNYVFSLLCNGQSVLDLYNTFVKTVMTMLQNVPYLNKKRNRKKKKSKSKPATVESKDNSSFSDSDVYEDVNNRFNAISVD